MDLTTRQQHRVIQNLLRLLGAYHHDTDKEAPRRQSFDGQYGST